MQLFLEHYVRLSFKRHMAYDALIEQYAHGVYVGGLVLVFQVAYGKLWRGIFSLAHEGSGSCQSAVVGGELVHLLRNTEVDQLDVSVLGQHDVRRVDVAVDVSCVVQRYES